MTKLCSQKERVTLLTLKSISISYPTLTYIECLKVCTFHVQLDLPCGQVDL